MKEMRIMEQETKKARDPFIDVLKGFTIILVVLGHTVHLYAPNYEASAVFRFCYSFHMALFFAISGYLAASKTKHNLQWIGKRAQRLLVPWMIWTTIGTLFVGSGWQSLIEDLIIEPSLWFLPCLFLCEVCLLLLVHVKKYPAAAFIALYVILAVLGIDLHIRMLENVVIFLMFYLAGYLLRKHIPAFNKRTIGCIAIVSVILYGLFMQVYTFGMDGAERFAQEIAMRFDLERGTALLKMAIWANSRYIIAFLGSVASASVVWTIYKWGGVPYLRPVFTYLGKNTMSIYLLSGYFKVAIFNGYINFALSLILGIAMPCLVSWILKKFPKVSAILFGV